RPSQERTKKENANRSVFYVFALPCTMPKQIWKRLAQLAGFLIMCMDLLKAQPVSFRHFSVGQGLPNYSVLSITQDKRGFMWLGTADGLCRYDGLRFKIYKRVADDSLSISNNNILC